MVDLEKF